MKILVLATDYPLPDGYVSQYFIHTRNIEYVKCGVDVTVMSFTAKFNYQLDDVKIVTFDTLIKELESNKFDILVSHAPNLRNHYLFLIRYGRRFRKIVFFFHGHEVLISSKVYPKPYKYTNNDSFAYKVVSEIYDLLKLKIWRHFFTRQFTKSEFVFVSNWMYGRFIEFIKMDPELIRGRTHIIYNSIGNKFEIEKYDKNAKKEYDFITIRNLLDKSKYCIDVVYNLAKTNPDYKFCVIGKGRFFDYNECPKNLLYINKHLNHDEVVDFLNKSKFALMPTRADAQGVMACEMASFGITLITSDIQVCREVFDEFPNVLFIDNGFGTNFRELELERFFNQEYIVNERFYIKNTIYKEIELFEEIVGDHI